MGKLKTFGKKKDFKRVKESSNYIEKILNFLREVKLEGKKITWPGKKQVLITALVVIFFSFFIGAYLSLLDVIYNFIISYILR